MSDTPDVARNGSGVGVVIAMLLMLIITMNFLTLSPAVSQSDEVTADTRATTGGAQTLEDILARQSGQRIDDSFRREALGDPDSAAGIAQQLGTLGGASDPELWRAIRFGDANVTASNAGAGATVLVQDGGMTWLSWRDGPLKTYGGNLLLIMLIALTLFYLTRDKIMIEGEKTGKKIKRFGAVERFGHWLLAGSFILLGITGLVSLFGRTTLLPLLGKENYAAFALDLKWVHNNVAWAFMIGLVLITVMWIVHNIPNRHDVVWLLKGGGLFSKGSHPPARKFNAGQKIIFWMVVLLGTSVSLTGLSLLFPFELPMFAATFEKLNAIGLPQVMGLGELNTALAPHEEMQFAQLWHSIVAFVMMAVIIAHIYLGSIGMEGAFDAMGSGEVELQWAKEHHGLWVDEVMEKTPPKRVSEATPAE